MAEKVKIRGRLAGVALFIGLTGAARADAAGPVPSPAIAPIPIGSRRELFVDNFLVERLLERAELRLNQPTPQNVVLVSDEGWEGNALNYVTVFRDGSIYRMYYRGEHYSYLGGKDRPSTNGVYCYAESPDGVHWTKPDLGIFNWNGSKKNNIILDGIEKHAVEAFAPFRDTNPRCEADARYKALGCYGPKPGLYAFKSADGIHWNLLQPDPVITVGDFDSLNLAFWDPERGDYREYHREFRGVKKGMDNILHDLYAPVRGRDIRTGSSPDFRHWTDPVFLDYSANVDPGRSPDRPEDPARAAGSGRPSARVSQFYTNQIIPYYRAPYLLLGFPTRYTDRGWTESAKRLPNYDYRLIRRRTSLRDATAVTDGMLISSRDREHFSVWPESFIRPGLRTRDTWFYGDIYQNWGLVETRSPFEDGLPELSIYVTERTLQETGGVLRRYTLRIDGFVSLHAPLVGGELVTKPVTFAGNRLFLNVSTSAAGAVRVELQGADGRPLPGFTLPDCDEIYGDDLERAVTWKANPDLAALAGKPVRMRFQVRDADVYSFHFTKD